MSFNHLHDTFLDCSISLLYQGAQDWTQPSRCKLTKGWVVSKSMMTRLNFLHVYNIFQNCLLDYLFHHLSGHWGVADQSVAPPILLLAFLEESSDGCFLPALRSIPQAAMTFQR